MLLGYYKLALGGDKPGLERSCGINAFNISLHVEACD